MAVVGYHGSIKKTDFTKSIKWHYETNNVRCLQICMKSPRKWCLSKLKDDDAITCCEFVKENDIFLVSHGSYLINMGTAFDPDGKEVMNAVDDLVSIHRISGIGSIFHVGKHKKQNIQTCLDNMEIFIRQVIHKTTHLPSPPHFILETAAGQGTELCVSMEELAEFYQRFNDINDRVRLCVDTCHIFAAGYDLTTHTKSREFVQLFEQLIGWEYVDVVHLNDSKCPCGSKKDKHENINQGYIGKDDHDGFATFIHEMELRNIPMILETPTGTLDKHEEIELVHQLSQRGAELVHQLSQRGAELVFI